MANSIKHTNNERLPSDLIQTSHICQSNTASNYINMAAVRPCEDGVKRLKFLHK
jgi:hypothetical protein